VFHYQILTKIISSGAQRERGGGSDDVWRVEGVAYTEHGGSRRPMFLAELGC